MFEHAQYFGDGHREACDILELVYEKISDGQPLNRPFPIGIPAHFTPHGCSCAFAGICFWCRDKPNPLCVCGDYAEHHGRGGCLICNASPPKFHCKRFRKDLDNEG